MASRQTRRALVRPVRTESPSLQRLRRRLREAEETIEAIRGGHVEALVVQSPDGEQVFALRTADQPFRLMVERMREGALTLAADGTILYCNQRLAELVGLPPERVTGQPLAQFLDADQAAQLGDMLRADSYREEFRLRDAAGTAIPAQFSSAALQIEGLRTLAVVVTDLTHERTERGLREANRLKDEFLATLSHELRTPLNVILGWTRILLTVPLEPATRQRALELIDRNARLQAQLVNDLVDMSRMATGKLQVDPQPLALAPALDAALEGIRPAARAKGLTITTDWDAAEATVLADPTRLQQILWNLLSNAVKFTPTGGTITVRSQALDGTVRIEVCDTGIGIEPDFLPQVFDRFRQADSATTRSYGGLGLGLAIVRDLVRLHGGDVEAHSDGAGCGARFVVTLPRATAARRRARQRRRGLPLRSRLAGQTVMLLEDHDDSRDLLVEALRQAGAAVAAFATGREAWLALERIRPSVVVADIALPGEDGYTFLRRLRAHVTPAIRTVPAIAVTAYATLADRSEALAGGFQQHLAKPIDPGGLVQAIVDVTRRARGQARRPAPSRRAAGAR